MIRPEKYCVECGARIRARAVVCPECGVSQTDSSPRAKKHCHECGAVIRGNAAICPKCGVEQGRGGSAAPYTEGSPEDIKAAGEKKIIAGICGILLGYLGVHKFILGLTTPAIIMLLVTIGGIVLTPCLGVPILAPVATTIIATVEGIIYHYLPHEER
jgi:TM2 domain-containing membrane protein YozV/RNA polymerase subunit RPABC4/transcription elongation factor Spt4